MRNNLDYILARFEGLPDFGHQLHGQLGRRDRLVRASPPRMRFVSHSGDDWRLRQRRRIPRVCRRRLFQTHPIPPRFYRAQNQLPAELWRKIPAPAPDFGHADRCDQRDVVARLKLVAQLWPTVFEQSLAFLQFSQSLEHFLAVGLRFYSGEDLRDFAFRVNDESIARGHFLSVVVL
jgi:hypothetical protein